MRFAESLLYFMKCVFIYPDYVCVFIAGYAPRYMRYVTPRHKVQNRNNSRKPENDIHCVEKESQWPSTKRLKLEPRH